MRFFNSRGEVNVWHTPFIDERMFAVGFSWSSTGTTHSDNQWEAIVSDQDFFRFLPFFFCFFLALVTFRFRSDFFAAALDFFFFA